MIVAEVKVLQISQAFKVFHGNYLIVCGSETLQLRAAGGQGDREGGQVVAGEREVREVGVGTKSSRRDLCYVVETQMELLSVM